MRLSLAAPSLVAGAVVVLLSACRERAGVAPAASPAALAAGCYVLAWASPAATALPELRPDSIVLDTTIQSGGLLADRLDRTVRPWRQDSTRRTIDWRVLSLRAWRPLGPDSVLAAFGDNYSWWTLRLQRRGETLEGTGRWWSDDGTEDLATVTGQRVACPQARPRSKG